MTKKSNQFNVFGTRPDNAICLPDIPYSIRLNCKDGGLFVGGYEPQHRKTNPDQKIDITIVKVSKFFGTLGKTENILWLQLFFVPSINVDSKIIPKNTVCCTYIKKQSIAHLFNKVQEAMEAGDPGMGIFTLGFNKELGSLGTYYSVSFDWRERSQGGAGTRSDEEMKQLELIGVFMNAYGDRLADLEGTRSLTCVDGWTTKQIQELTSQVQLNGSSQHSLPAA